jgi:hypothetical protein
VAENRWQPAFLPLVAETSRAQDTAMTEILSDALAVVLLPGGLLALVRYARRDVFAGPGIGHDPGMEPGALDLAGLRRRRR